MYISSHLFLKRFFSVIGLMFFVFVLKAQLIATFPLKSGGGSVTPSGSALISATNPNIKTDTAVVGSEITSTPNGTFNGTGVRIRPSNLVWPTSPNDNFSLSVSVSPKVGFDYVLSSVTFKDSAHDGTPNLSCRLAYQVNGSGNWVFIGTPQVCTNLFGTTTIGGLNEGFYSGNTYKFRFYFYGNGANDKNQGFRMLRLIFNGNIVTPPSIAPVVITGALGTATKYSNTVTSSSYTISNAGVNVKVVNKSGVCFGTNNTPTLANIKTTDIATNGVASATFNSTITGLTPSTTYYTRAYAITQVDTVYGAIVSFTTQPPTVPTLNTNTPANILSNKATTGGNSIDSGGVYILEKGVLYSSLNNNLTYGAALPTKSTSDGIGSANFATTIKSLIPNTKYYVRAYARNSIGTGYGNLDSFVTAAPVPIITAAPGNLDYGDVTFNTAAPLLSYKLNANYLAPAAGILTLNATNGYTISSTLNGAFNPSILLNYTGSSLANKIIFVKSPSTPYGLITGTITHIGGGTNTPNADTTFLKTNVIQNQDTLSNAGSDFWCGFGYQVKMKEQAGDANEAKMSIYVATGNQPATVHVELTSGGYNQLFSIPANSVHEFKNFPTGDATDEFNPTGLPDARLYYTGKSKRSIHIYSDNGVPVSAFMHTYTTSNTAAGAMLFPSNTWNSSYTVQAFGGKINNGNDAPNSFFFVVAKDDNTPVTFTPKNDVLDSNANTLFKTNSQALDVKYKKDSTYTVILNKGEVFNAMGFIQGTGGNVALGLDLSGSTVKTSCDKRIAVFGGNGRCFVNTPACASLSTGSDHLLQQMFPSVAWGTKYLTMPPKGQPYCYFRIFIQNPASYGNTKVWINNPLHTTPLIGLVNNLYYEYLSDQPLLIESDKPINVSQFLPTPQCGSTPSVDGGPEMIILSPVQQSITSATLYSAAGKDQDVTQTNVAGTTGNHGSFINVIIPTSGVATFKLDNSNLVDTGKALGSGCSSTAPVPPPCPALYANGTKINVDNAFRKHPQDTSYSIASFWVLAPATHTLAAKKGFNAIAYGLGAGESYGYNAGTAINNLSAIKFSLNPYGADTTTTSVKTCVGNLVTLQIALPYDTTTVNSIIWDPEIDTSLYKPAGPQTGAINANTSKPAVVGTILRDGRTFYIYKSPVQYTFLQEGAYKVKISVNGTFVSDCGGTDVQYMNIIVGHDDISFTATQAGCGSRNVTIADATTPLAGTSIVKWAWNFGDNSPIDTARVGVGNAPNPSGNPHTYPANNAYYIKLTTINSIGCFSYDSVLVDLAFGINTSFTSFRDTACVGENVVFTPTSSANAVKWFWDFGDSSPIDSSNATPVSVSHSYTTAGTYIISHFVKTSAGCSSAVVKDTILISKTPVASFVTPAGVCLPGSTQFTNSSDTSAAGPAIPYTFHWSFGTGNAGDTSNVKNPVFGFIVAPPNAVTLVATSRFGCKSTVYSQVVNNVFVKPTVVIANTSSNKVCVGSNASFFDASSGTNQTVNSWYWNFGDGGTATTQNPTHAYTSNGIDTVRLVIGTDKGCISDTVRWTIKVNPKPVAGTILPSSCITSGSLLFQDNSTLASDADIQTPYTYTWNFGEPSSGANNTSILKDDFHSYAGIGKYYIKHSITTLNGCTDTKTDTFTISGSKPLPNYSFSPNRSINPLLNQVCNTDSVKLMDASTISNGTIKKVVINWDNTDRYGNGANYYVTTDNTPQNGVGTITPKTYNFKYPYSQLSKSNVKVRIQTFNSDSCYSDTTITVTVFGTPAVRFDTIRGICVDGAPKRINFGYDSTGSFDGINYPKLIGRPKYSGSGVYNDSMFNPATVGAGTHFIKVLYQTFLPFNNGCRDSAYAPITVWALPIVKFDTALIKCEGNSILFTDQSTAGIGAGNIKSWLWKFGEPTSGFLDSSKINPASHLYTNYGSYNITLKVTSDSGCSNTSTSKSITINPKPKVGFISPAGTCAGTPVSFTDTSKIADGTQSLFTHFWNFGDPASGINNTATGTPLITPNHTYTTTPPDSVKLIVTSNNGCVDSFAVKLSSSIFPKQNATYLANGKPKDKADFTRVCLGTNIKFASGIPANNTYWIFGDSGTLVNNAASPLHTYPTSGLFTGQFYADDINGCRTDTVAMKVEIWALPTVKFDTALVKCEGSNIAFIDQSIAGTGAGSIKSWLWKFGEPTSGALDSSKINPASHLYTKYGSYNITLKVTSDSGCSNTSISKTIIINPKPKVGFISPAGTCAGTPVGFTDTSKIADGTQSLFTHYWNFGDPASGANNTATGTPLPTPTHLYASTPLDSVKLIVTSNSGCVDSFAVKLSGSIFPKQSATYFANGKLKGNADITRVCLDNTIKFASGLPANNTYWIFGDSGILVNNSASPLHKYPTSGLFTGQFYADDNNGCRTDTVAMKVEIWALPTSIIQVNNPTCEKQLISFIDKSVASSSTGNINTWLWKFGEPSSGFLDSSALQNPVHKYNSYGNYNVTLTVTSDSGCKATIASPTIVNVRPKPVVKFVLPTSVCLPLAAQFTDTSKIADGTESQFTHSWTFGDLGSGTSNYATGKPLATITHLYSSSANYKILLVITSKDGCIDSSSQILTSSALRNQPKADYNVNTTNKDTPTVCLGNPITFKDASIGTVKSYWIWGDEGLTTYLGNTPPPHLFSPAGSYYGIHFIDDIFGCRSDTADFLTIVDSFPVTVGGEKYILKGSSAYLNPYVSGATTILWTPIVPAGLTNDYLDYNDVENPICTPLDSVIYRIDAKTEGGCAAPPVYFTVKLFIEPNIPNAFSPNGDGVNDTWDITSLQYFSGSSVQVFTRSGQLVYNSLGYSKPWKGNDLSGSPLPVGVYYYIIKFGLGLQPKSGSITILR